MAEINCPTGSEKLLLGFEEINSVFLKSYIFRDIDSIKLVA